MDVKVVSFDLDDTVWDSRRLLENAELVMMDYMKENYFDVWKLCGKGLLSQTMKEFAAMDKYKDIAHDYTRLRLAVLDHLALKAGMTDKEERIAFAENCFKVFIKARNDIEEHVYPEVVETFKGLRSKGYYLCTITNGNADVSAHPLFPSSMFDVHVTAIAAGASKPHPAPFNMVVDVYKDRGIAAKNVLHVGDSIESDVIGAKNVGMLSCWRVPQGMKAEHEEAIVSKHGSIIDLKVYGIHEILHHI